MIFSVSDKGGLEEKKFCPMYSPGLLKFAVTFRLLYLHTVSQGAYKHTLTYTKNRQIIIIIIIKKHLIAHTATNVVRFSAAICGKERRL